jgi:hypothetical protein
MLYQTVQGADKTCVSVATGQTEYHPFYLSAGNLHNDMRRAHREGVLPVAFLSIPKCECVSLLSARLIISNVSAASRDADNDNDFRNFRKQLYHAQIAKVLEPLRRYMTEPLLMRCPDGYYRRVIFELGPFIADYPEQVYLAGVVQGWCPKYVQQLMSKLMLLLMHLSAVDAGPHLMISTTLTNLERASISPR